MIYIITGALTLNEKEPSVPSNQSEIREDSETIKKKNKKKKKEKEKEKKLE